MNINDLQKARRENDFKTIVKLIKQECMDLNADEYEFKDKEIPCKYDVFKNLHILEERIALEFLKNNRKDKEKYLLYIGYTDKLKPFVDYLKVGSYHDYNYHTNKEKFQQTCKNSKDMILLDEKYQQQKKVSKFNISHLGIKLSSRFRPKCLKRLALKPFVKLNSEVCYKLSLLLYKPKHLNKKLEYLKMGTYKSNCNCVETLANYYKEKGDKENQIETLRYGAAYNFQIAKSLADLLLETINEDNVKEVIGMYLYYHAEGWNNDAKKELIEIFSCDTYGVKDLDIALLISYNTSTYGNYFIEKYSKHFDLQTDEAIENFTKSYKEYTKQCNKIRKEEELKIQKEREERAKQEAESTKKRASNVTVSHNSSYYDLSNLDELLADVPKDSILMSRLVTIYLENNLKFDSKFINVIINNCHGWKREWAEVMRAILFKYGYARNLQIKDKKYGLMINNAKTVKYKPEDAFEIFKYIANKGNNGILESRARYELAKCYAEGYGTAKDKEKANEYFAMVNSRYTNLFTSAQNDIQTVLAKKAFKASDKAVAIKNKDVKGMLECYQDDKEIIFKVIDIYLKDKLPFDREFLDCVLDYRKFGVNNINTIKYVIALAYKYNYLTEEEKNNYKLVDMFSNIESYALKHQDTHAYNELAKCYEEGFLVSKNIDKAIEYYKKSDKAYAKKLQDKQDAEKAVQQIPEKTKIANFVTNAYERFLQEYPEKGKIVEYRANRYFLNDIDMKFIYELLNNGYEMYYLFNEKGDYIGSSYLGVKGIKDFASVKSEIDKKDRLERERKLEQQKKLEQQQLEAQRLEQQRKLDEQKRLEELKKLEEEKKLKEQTKKVTTSSVNSTSKTSVTSTLNNTTSTQNTTTTSAQVNTSKNVSSTGSANAKISEVRKKYGYVEKPTDMPSKDEYGNEITSIAKRQKLYSKQLDEYYKSQGVYEKNILNAIKESSNRKCNQIDEKTLFAINDSKPIHDKSGFEFEINHNYKKMVQNYKKNYIRHLGDLGAIGVEITDIKYCNSKGQVMNDVWIAERELAGLPVYAKVIVEVEIYDNCLTFKSDIDYISEMYNLMNAFEESDLAKFSTFSEFTQKTTLGFETEQRSRNMRHSAIADGKDVYKQVIRKAVSNTFKNNHIILHEKAIVRNNIFPAYVIDYSLVFKWQKQY